MSYPSVDLTALPKVVRPAYAIRIGPMWLFGIRYELLFSRLLGRIERRYAEYLRDHVLSNSEHGAPGLDDAAAAVRDRVQTTISVSAANLQRSG